MNRSALSISFLTIAIFSGLTGCTAAKLEARLEANPQCKDVVNPKTGALMPCPGSDRAFYIAAGLEAPRPAKTVAMAPVEPSTAQPTNSATNVSPAPSIPAVNASNAPQSSAECKPQIHKKSGGLIPCLPPE